MNKLELSIELSFDIDAGTIEPFDDVKLNTNQLIHPEVFFERYQNYKMDLKDKAYISTTATLTLDNNKLPGNGTRCYQVISILSGTKSILSTHLCSDG